MLTDFSEGSNFIGSGACIMASMLNSAFDDGNKCLFSEGEKLPNKMASEGKLYPTAAKYEPIKVEGLKEGDTKYWCRCGLSKNQPWCDGSHKGTGITPMKWTVPKTQDAYYLCACKQTKNEPLCDGSHKNAKEILGEQAVKCEVKDNHNKNCALCTRCGWNPNLEF